MKCPVLTFMSHTANGSAAPLYLNCIEEECAWWYDENIRCSIPTIAQGSKYIHKAVLDIAKKTPLGSDLRL